VRGGGRGGRLGLLALGAALLALAVSSPSIRADNGYTAGAAAVTSVTLGGDVTGASGSNVVSKISGLSTSQTAWFFDFANVTGCASDANLGTIGTCSGGNGPLLTIGQAYKRLGGHAPTFAGGAPVVFTVLSSQPSGSASSDPWGAFAPNVPNSMFELVGSLTASGSTFAAGAVTQIVRSSSGNDFKVNVAAATSPVAGMLLFDSTVAGGSYAWIDSIAAGVATCTQPMAAAGLTTPTNAPTFVVDGASWTVGDTLQLYTVPTIYADLLAPSEGTQAASGASFTAGASWIQSINFGDPSGAGTSNVTIRPVGISTLSLVRSDAFVQLNGLDASFSMDLSAAACWFSSSLEMRGNSILLGGAVATVHAATTVFHEYNAVKNDSILHATTGVFGVVQAFNLHAPPTLIIEPSANLVMRAGTANGVIWGAATVAVYQGGCLLNRTGGTWANNMLVTTLQLDSTAKTTGSAYNDPTAGLWTNGVSLTSANIDTWGGLQDPISGARYTN
jgi:hypothetical protein